MVVGDDMLQPGVDPLTPVSQPAQLGQAALQALLGAGGFPAGQAPTVQLGGQQVPAAGARGAGAGASAGVGAGAAAGAAAGAGAGASVGGSAGEDDGEGGPLVLLEAELGGSKPGDWAGEGHRG